MAEAAYSEPKPKAAFSKEIDPNDVLDEVLSENRGYGKVFSLGNTAVMSATPDRIRDGYGEFWHIEDQGTTDLPHPQPGKNVIELYDQTLSKDPARLKQHIEGELYHGMKNDPYFNKLREEFKANYTPAELERIKAGNSWWDDARPTVEINPHAEDAMHDAYIRGIKDPSVLLGIQIGKLEYSPKQLQLLKEMRDYINTGNAGDVKQ